MGTITLHSSVFSKEPGMMSVGILTIIMRLGRLLTPSGVH